jgi:hypothetical protein
MADRPTSIELRKDCWRRWGVLDSKAATFLSRCQDITDYLLPYAGRYFASDRNRADNRFRNILDTHASWCLDVLESGMVSYASPPTGQWFGLAPDDPDLLDFQPVTKWLGDASDAIDYWLRRSNFYRVQPAMYKEGGAFGMAAAIMEPDEESLLWLYPVTAGEYRVARNERGKVDTFYRVFELTVRQCVQKFGIENCSKDIRRRAKHKEWDAGVTVIHAIEPRNERDPDKDADKLNMPWRSVYFERGDGSPTDGVLSEGGYKRFPVLCPAWGLLNGEDYGTGPGAIALSHVKSLQHRHHRLAQVIDQQARPAMVGPTSMQNNPGKMGPGQWTFSDSPHPQGSVRPLWEANARVDFLGADIQDIRRQLERVFFTDAFLMFTRTEIKSSTTLGEIQARRDEQFSMLGPQTARWLEEMHREVIEYAFAEMAEQGKLPPDIPPELEGRALDVVFESVMAKAQRATGLAGLDRYLNTAIALAPVMPAVLHKVNAFKVMDTIAQMTGVDPEVNNDDDTANGKAEAQAKAQAAADQAQLMESASKTAQNLAGAQMTDPSVLSGMAQAVGGQPQ